MLDWQLEQLGCDCPIHRYHVAHICACGEVISHSQSAWDAHRFHGGMLNFSPEWYKHGDTSEEVFDRLHVFGELPYFEPIFRQLWQRFADH